MSPFDYLSVLLSIFVGLGLSHLLSAAHKLMISQEQVRPYWVSCVWAAAIFLAQIQFWWASFGYRRTASWNFFEFLFLLLIPITLYLLSASVLPEVAPGEAVDMKAHYFRHHRLFFTLGALVPLLYLLGGVARGQSLTGPPTLFNLLFLALAVLAAASRREWLHAALAMLVLLLFVVFIALFSLRML